MSRKKPQMITCDVTTLKIFLKHMQPLNDKISGLKVQVTHWQKECERLQMELAKMDVENQKIAKELTHQNHLNKLLGKQNEELRGKNTKLERELSKIKEGLDE